MNSVEILKKCANISDDKDFKGKMQIFFNVPMNMGQRMRLAQMILDKLDKELVEKARGTKV